MLYNVVLVSVIQQRESAIHTYIYIQGFPGGSVVKKLPFSAGDVDSIPESKDALETEMATLSSILAWEIPWIRNLVG